MTDLPQRTVTGLVYGAVALGALLAPREIFALGLAVVIAIGLFELFSLRGAGVAAGLQLLVLAVGAADLQ